LWANFEAGMASASAVWPVACCNPGARTQREKRVFGYSFCSIYLAITQADTHKITYDFFFYSSPGSWLIRRDPLRAINGWIDGREEAARIDGQGETRRFARAFFQANTVLFGLLRPFPSAAP
jgi:hypothetical protein